MSSTLVSKGDTLMRTKWERIRIRRTRRQCRKARLAVGGKAKRIKKKKKKAGDSNFNKSVKNNPSRALIARQNTADPEGHAERIRSKQKKYLCNQRKALAIFIHQSREL